MEARLRWLGSSGDISFQPEDFDILDLTLSLIPELRICALAVKRARAMHVSYPIESVDEIIKLLDAGQQFVGAGHHIKAASVRYYMPQEFFPIEHEGELISRVYLALMRCHHEMVRAASVHPTMHAALDMLSSLEGEGQ